MIPDGYRARWRDTEYEASPDEGLVRLYSDRPVPGFDEVRPGRYRRLATMDEITWFGYARTVGVWSDQPVLVLSERPDELLIEYRGGRATVAMGLGLARVDLGVYQGWVPRGTVREVRVERLDA